MNPTEPITPAAPTPPASSRRTLFIVGGLIAVVLIAAAVLVNRTSSHSGKVAVKLYVLPTDAQMTVDGKSVTPGTIYLTPGSHVAVTTHVGYDTQTTTSFFTAKQTDAAFDIALVPESNDAKSWFNSHQSLYADREARGSARSRTNGLSFQAANPIVKQLPFENYIYTIGYIQDPSDPSGQSIIIQIDAPDGFRNGAVQQIKTLGFDPANYKIQFLNYVNPFSS